MAHIAWFAEISKDDTALVGGKGANLGEMYRARFPIPPGFVITTDAFKLFLAENDLLPRIAQILSSLDVTNNTRLQDAAQQVQQLVLDAKMPAALRDDIVEAYGHINVDYSLYKEVARDALNVIRAGRDVPYVAVRSSATAEDLAGASFAGQQATFVNVKGTDMVLDAVQKCWASLYTARAIYYRVKNNFPHEKVFIAVVVQRMVNSDRSGVAFTANPSTNNRSEIVLEAGFGLGDAVVAGEITPDHYVVSKSDFILTVAKPAVQAWMYTRDDMTGKTYKKDLTPERGGRQKLSNDEVIQLAKICASIEQHYDMPMDIEYAFEGGRLFIVQARPITTLDQAQGQSTSVVSSSATKLLEGLAASPGLATGPVRILSSPDELDKVQKGDVLVARMTSPDYVPAIERACAIVTDEGGQTCFSGDTLILTDKGFLHIREAVQRIQEGGSFFILAYNSKKNEPEWKKVIKGGRSIRRDIRRISISQTNHVTRNTVDLTADHKVFTLAGRRLLKKEIQQVLQEKEALTLLERLPRFSQEFVDKKQAYLAGALMSDGHVHIDYYKGNPRRGSITFTQKQVFQKEAFIQTVKQYYQDVFSEQFTYERLKENTSILQGRQIQGFATDFVSYRLAPALQLFKLIQNTAQWACTFNEACALSFLAGLIDGDGCFYNNRLHIYVSKKYVLEGIIVSCLRLGIIPQVTPNRESCFNVQILERMDDILQYTTRVHGKVEKKALGNRLLSAKQLLGDVLSTVNVGGKIRPYVDKNLLIDSKKIEERILPIMQDDLYQDLVQILEAPIRMQRVRQVDSFNELEVFNLEVEADNELDHNYVVFTKRYTPLLVSNSHAAIVSREMRIPCVVGTEEATTKLKDGQLITVDGSSGAVYLGRVGTSPATPTSSPVVAAVEHEHVVTATKVYMNLGEPDKIAEYASLPFEGIGLMRLEFLITSVVKAHPLALIEQKKGHEFVAALVSGISTVARAIFPRPLVVRFSDFKTNEYRNLAGGAAFEPHEENPMIGWRGVSRYVSDKYAPAFALECQAIKSVRDSGLTNVHVMLPFVRTTDEVLRCLDLLQDAGLVQSRDFHIWIMAEVPAVALCAESFARLPIAGCSIGSNDLTQGVLCVDRDSVRLAKMGYFDERNEAVLHAMHLIISGFKKHHKTVSICGQAPSEYPDLLEFLIKEGVTSISVNPDVVVSVRETVASVERKLLLSSVLQ